MKYKLINKQIGEEHLCDKVVMDGFNYYVSNGENLQKDFVTYQQALKLKELGFDEPCLVSWNFFTNEVNFNGQPSKFSSEDVIQLPSFSAAFRWFREKYNLFSVVNVKYVNGASYFLRIETPPTNGYQYFDEGFKTYEEAELACLEKLLKICESKTK